jgi:hypothetical protein
LPKQVLQDILNTVDVCNDSDQPFDNLKDVLLGQFGKSMWQSYFYLLRLPMEMPGLKPSVLMGKLKQHFPPGVPDTDLFLAMFLIHLPPSVREVVGAGNHKTAVAIVKGPDTLWDARGGQSPTVAADMTQCSRSPAPAGGKKSDKRNGNAHSKVTLLPTPIFYLSTTLAMACVNFTTTPTRLTGVFPPCLVGKLKSRRTFTRSAATSAHSTAMVMHFPANARLIFWTDELTKDRYLVDAGATLSIVPCTSKTNPSDRAPAQGIRWTIYPSWGYVEKKLSNSEANFSLQNFCKPLWQVPSWVIDFLRKFKVTVAPEISQILFPCTAAAPSPPSVCFA